MKPGDAPHWAMRVRNEALEEAAKAADGYRHKEAGFRSNEPDKSVYGWGTARREIAQAIRRLKSPES